MTTREWREWVLEHHGGWRQWALFVVSCNWRIRKRLPRLTAKAIALGMIPREGNPE